MLFLFNAHMHVTHSCMSADSLRCSAFFELWHFRVEKLVHMKACHRANKNTINTPSWVSLSLCVYVLFLSLFFLRFLKRIQKWRKMCSRQAYNSHFEWHKKGSQWILNPFFPCFATSFHALTHPFCQNYLPDTHSPTHIWRAVSMWR